MIRVINADKMIEDTEAMRQVSDAIMIDVIVKYINDNSVEMEEMRHGEWIKLDTAYKYSDVYKCSICDRRIWDDKGMPLSKIYERNPYCHCGAKMDKEKTE